MIYYQGLIPTGDNIFLTQTGNDIVSYNVVMFLYGLQNRIYLWPSGHFVLFT